MEPSNNKERARVESLDKNAGERRPSRRELFKQVGGVGIAMALPATIAAQSLQLASPVGEEREPLASFNVDEAITICAILDRLIPSDENGPGALEARVDRYIDRLLRSPQNASRSPNNPDTNLTEAYSAGLRAVNSYAINTQGLPFANLSPEKRDAVLTAMQENRATGFAPDSRTFFNLVRAHALEGMFGDPYYGGNAGLVGWDLLGFPGIKLSFTEEEQRTDVTVQSSRKGTMDYPIFKTSKEGI
jgi:gluconate 2-dehydrogenase gamma chain